MSNLFIYLTVQLYITPWHYGVYNGSQLFLLPVDFLFGEKVVYVATGNRYLTSEIQDHITIFWDSIEHSAEAETEIKSYLPVNWITEMLVR